MTFRKKIWSLLLALSIAPVAFAQQDEAAQVENITRVTFLTPGISHEHKLGKNITLMGHVFLSPYASFLYSNAFGEESFEAEFALEPAVSVQYRYYYNFDRRQPKGQRTAKNSMNYFAPEYTAVFTRRRLSSTYIREESARTVHTIGAVWGLQRNLPGRLSLDFNAGLGYQFALGHRFSNEGVVIQKSYGNLTILSGLTLGIWLGKKEP